MFGPYEEMTVYRPGTTIPDKKAMVERTQEHLALGTEVICEAAFMNYNNYCAVDILRKTDNAVLPASLSKLGDSCFENTSLKSISIPGSVKTISERCFANNQHLSKAIISEGVPSLPLSKEWTPLLLQSILRFYSKECGAHTIYGLEGQAGDTLHAMVVSNRSEIQSFGDAVIAVLLENGISQRRFEAEELRHLLVDRGMIRLRSVVP